MLGFVCKNEAKKMHTVPKRCVKLKNVNAEKENFSARRENGVFQTLMVARNVRF